MLLFDKEASFHNYHIILAAIIYLFGNKGRC